MEESGGRGKLHADINNLFSAKQGLESDKITERKKSASSLLILLERSHVLDFVENSSLSERRHGNVGKGGKGASTRQLGGVTWSSLFRSVQGYIAKETEVIQKLDEKGSDLTATAHSNRTAKKKDVPELLRAYIRGCTKSEWARSIQDQCVWTL